MMKFEHLIFFRVYYNSQLNRFGAELVWPNRPVEHRIIASVGGVTPTELKKWMKQMVAHFDESVLSALAESQEPTCIHGFPKSYPCHFCQEVIDELEREESHLSAQAQREVKRGKS